jgi:predicted HTH domain antitoxin
MKSLTINLAEDANLNDVKMLTAAALFKQGILSSGQAAEMAGVTRLEFLETVGNYVVSIFGETEEDLKISEFQKLSI